MKKLACMLYVLGTTAGLSATGAVAWDGLDSMMSSLQVPWQGKWNWQWQLPWQGRGELQSYIKGNDTGGIIAWSPENEARAREWTDQFCASYNKYPRITAVHRQYGDYISFNCLWDPTVARYALPQAPVHGPR